MAKRTGRWGAALALALAPGLARAGDALEVLEVKVDRPTLHALGVQALIAGDDDRDATVTVRVREQGGGWRAAAPLLRVWPETVAPAVPQQFAGSVFDLAPATTYEIELHLVDADGPVDLTQTVMATTRPVPADPGTPTEVPVADVAGLQAALKAAAPGTVIVLAPGTYAGSFTLMQSGTPAAPIVIRGQSQAEVVLDGQGCGCNVLEVYGSHAHIEDLTIRGATRAIRFQGADTTGNVVRRVVIEDVVHGIGSKAGQTDFYLCDNDITGRLVWPWTFAGDAGQHWDDRGIEVTGDGHVICHNRLRGFGDPVLNMQENSRAWDVVGNDIYDSYDGTELDRSEGNTRLWHNRFTNVMNPISVQPSQGGPVYVLRNVVLNAPEEQLKLKSVNTMPIQEPSGVIVAHNTFVSPSRALNLQAPIVQHNAVLLNNLFIGPAQLAGKRTVDWTAKLNGLRFDGNGYYPDGEFWFGVVDGKNQLFPDFAAATASGTVEAAGRLLAQPIFAAGFVGPADPMAHQEAVDFALDPGSAAVDAGLALPGLNDASPGGPDLGARELGCPAPTYGPRPKALEGAIAAVNCAEDVPGETTGDPDETTGDPDETSGDPPTTGAPGDTTTGTGPLPTSGGDDSGLSGTPGDTGDSSGGAGTGGSATGGAQGDGGCGCDTSSMAPPGWLALALLGLRRRRRAVRSPQQVRPR